jgi:hypothetical protein
MIEQSAWLLRAIARAAASDPWGCLKPIPVNIFYNIITKIPRAIASVPENERARPIRLFHPRVQVQTVPNTGSTYLYNMHRLH